VIPVTSRESWDVADSDKNLPGQEYFCLKDFFPDQERKIPENPEFPEVFLAR
jgi:hypothetical protein